MGKIRRWFDFFFSEEKNFQKTSNKRKRGWGCVSCSNFDLDSPRYPAPRNPAPIVIDTDYYKHNDFETFEFIHVPNSNNFSRSLNEDAAAIKIQTAFRLFKARKLMFSLKGLIRLKSLTNSNAVKRQTSATLQCMQTMARVQAQIHARRIRMLEENQALQKQFQLKHEKEVEKLRMSKEWDATTRSKEQIEAQLQNKQEAAVKRERALAYAFNHQSASRRSTNGSYMSMDPNNPQWSWSWMERWNACRPWENQITTPQSKTHTTTTTRRVKSSSSRNRCALKEEDSKNICSKHSRRHSIGALPFKDQESLASMTSLRSNSGKAIPIRYEKTQSSNKKSSLDALRETAPVSSARRLSKNVAAVPGRGQSGPPRVLVAACK